MRKQEPWWNTIVRVTWQTDDALWAHLSAFFDGREPDAKTMLNLAATLFSAAALGWQYFERARVPNFDEQMFADLARLVYEHVRKRTAEAAALETDP